MIKFRQKYTEQDMMDKAIEYLDSEGIDYDIIPEKKADEVSKKNSRALVLESFRQNPLGQYEIKIRDAKLYAWTRKMLSEKFRMKITNVDEKERVFTAETEYLGVALEIILALGCKYNLSIVRER